MKLSFPKKEDGFKIASCQFCRLESYLITPEIDAVWNPSNLFYRSVILDKEGNVLSSGWPKFFNYGEKSDCYPSPQDFSDWNIQEKIDGSLVICDYVNETFSMRTRGTSSYIFQKNFKDFEQLLEFYPQLKTYLKQNSHLSLLFEIVTPNNIIVLRPTHLQFYFLGAIDKRTMQVVSDISFGFEVLQPKTYSFTKLSNIVEAVKFWKGQEGVVLNYNNNQNKIKIKSQWYCWIHKVKSQLNSDKALLKLYIEENMPNYKTFYQIIETNYDFEIAEQLKTNLQRIVEAGEEVNKKIKNIKQLIKHVSKLNSRKEQAKAIIETFSPTNPELISVAFSFLDDKKNISQIEKLIEKQLLTANI